MNLFDEETKMKSGLAFSNEFRSRAPLYTVWYQLTENCCLTHLRLLSTSPAIGMSQSVRRSSSLMNFSAQPIR